MARKMAALLLLLTLLMCAAPAACAEGGDGVKKDDIVYLGSWQDAPLRWIVLDAENTNAGDEGVFLLSESALANQGVVYSMSKAVWQGSEGQAWCADFAAQRFSPAERAAIPAVSKREEPLQRYGLSWGAVTLENEQVFFPSVVELGDMIGANDGDPGLSAAYLGDGKSAYYWLRTPHGTHTEYAGLVLEEDQVHDFLVWGNWGARPATNLGGEALLYLSAAERALAPGEIGAMPASANGEWKATVTDPALTLTVSETRFSDGLLTVRYENAPVGAWISVLVRDAGGKAVGYGCLAQAQSASGEVRFAPNVPEGGTLLLFAEQDNGVKNTNTASVPVTLSWTEEAPPTQSGEEDAPFEADTATESAAPAGEAAPSESEKTLLRDFLRETWMFAAAFVFVAILAVAVAVMQARERRRRW